MRNLIIMIISLVLLSSCGISKRIPDIVNVKDSTVIKTVVRDSLIIRDSVVIIPQEKVSEIAKDTLKMETSLAKASAYYDSTFNCLKGSIENKRNAEYKIKWKEKIVEIKDTLYLKEPQPYSVIEEVKYIPKIYKWALGFSIIVIVVTLIGLGIKIKRVLI